MIINHYFAFKNLRDLRNKLKINIQKQKLPPKVKLTDIDSISVVYVPLLSYGQFL